MDMTSYIEAVGPVVEALLALHPTVLLVVGALAGTLGTLASFAPAEANPLSRSLLWLLIVVLTVAAVAALAYLVPGLLDVEGLIRGQNRGLTIPSGVVVD